jgi:hypothetical protein
VDEMKDSKENKVTSDGQQGIRLPQLSELESVRHAHNSREAYYSVVKHAVDKDARHTGHDGATLFALHAATLSDPTQHPNVAYI